jgi:hypothetical protein
MGRAEISWKKRTEEGEKREVYAKHVGDQWLFYSREKRFDDWEPLAQPPLDDWLELLDGVRRRIGRRLLRPEEEQRVVKAILLRYPEAEV